MKKQVSEKTMSRLLKVFELHKRGVDGEAENATTLLGRLLKSNGLTMEDLEDGHDVAWFSFPCKNVDDRQLIQQVLSKVLNTNSISYSQPNGRNRSREYEMTPCQYAEAAVMISLYKEDLKVHLKRAMSAFIQANKIFASTSSSEPREYTEEERKEIAAMLAMVEGITPTQIRKQIGAE